MRPWGLTVPGSCGLNTQTNNPKGTTMKSVIWAVVGIGVGAGIMLAMSPSEGVQPTYLVPATPVVTTSVVPAPVSVPARGDCASGDDCHGSSWTPGPSEVQWPPVNEDPTGPPMDSDPTNAPLGPCGYGCFPYPPGDPRLGVPADPNPTPVPQAPWAPPDFGPYIA